MHFHWQNLNEKNDIPIGPPWHGRCWLRFGDYELKNDARTVRLEWRLGKLGLSFSLDWDDEDITLHGEVPGISLYLSFDRGFKWLYSLLPKKRLEYYPDTIVVDERECSFKVHSGKIWINIFGRTDGWSHKDPWWWHITLDPIKWLLGKEEYSTRTIAEFVDYPFTMPADGRYGESELKANIKTYESTWKRPRWFAKKSVRADIDITSEKVPVVPGKGENSWDCGDDHIHGLGGIFGCDSAPKAVAAYIEAVQSTRRRRR